MIEIALKNIKKTYDEGHPNQVDALRNVNLTFHAGKTYAIMGASGSGKSTLLNILGCLDLPSDGTYLWDGINMAGKSMRELTRRRAEDIGFVLQDFGLIDHMTAIDNCMAPIIFSGKGFRTAKQKALSVLTKLHIAELSKREVGKLSGGQKQRVAIARAIINEPQMILADEPTGALDSTNSAIILDTLLSLSNENTLIIIATHDHDAAARCDYTFYLKDGETCGI